MKSFLILLLCLGITGVLSAEFYDGYKVYRVSPQTELQKIFVRSLEGKDGYDFWTDVRRDNAPVDIMVNPEKQTQFVNSLKSIGIDVSVFIHDVQEMIKNQKVGHLNRAGMTWDAYYRLNDIYAWMEDLAAKYPNNVTMQIGGSTYENREIKGVKISFGPGRKAVFLEGGIHAREWISPATLTYIINELLTSADPAFRKVAQSFDWYIFPVTNPDGYEYSHTDRRLWRKTRTFYSSSCYGADPNRNWDAYWGTVGVDHVCTSDVYPGPRVFSEKSVETLSKYITKVGPNMVAYISFHSYTQLLLVPYGHVRDRLDNYNETVPIGDVALKALEARHGTRYKPTGNIAETIYLVSGGSIDWVKQEFKTPLVYVYELRDLGQYGFLLPPEQIIPNSEEVVDSLVAMFQEADRLGVVSLV